MQKAIFKRYYVGDNQRICCCRGKVDIIEGTGVLFVFADTMNWRRESYSPGNVTWEKRYAN